tara:strand:- start:1230 stop:1427 length:198 start_codon:yes stop_codon:yes gene_type:complete
MKATIEFELNDPGIGKEMMKELMVDHMVEILDQWTKGNAIITIEFETIKKEKNESTDKWDHIYIN